MADGADINIQALGAIGQAVNNTAANIANVSTSGYRPVRTVFESGPAYVSAISERSRSIGAADPGGADAPAGTASDSAQPNGGVDLAGEMVNLVSYRTSFQANVQVVRTKDQMSGTILDLFS